jgi:hypothetical protein
VIVNDLSPRTTTTVPGRVLREWRIEHSPNFEGARLVAAVRDGATIVIAPPGTRLCAFDNESRDSWRVAWWAPDCGDDIDGTPPLGRTTVALGEALLAMPRRVQRSALTLHRTAIRDLRAALRRSRQRNHDEEALARTIAQLARELDEAGLAAAPTGGELTPVIRFALRGATE